MMKLRIQIKKELNKPSTLSCTREDGSLTYSKLQLDFEIHDIAHYVVERQLGFKNAFYGLLSQGYQINDFMLPKEQRPESLQPQNLPPEALVTEHLVNLLTIDFMQSENEMDILEMFKIILFENKLPFPENFTTENLVSVKKDLKILMKKWNGIEVGESLELVFEM